MAPISKAGLAAFSEPQVSFETYAEQWLEARRSEGLRCVKGYRSLLTTHLSLLSGPIGDITGKQIRQHLARMRQFGLAPRTVRNARNLLNVILEAAVADGVIASNPMPTLRLVDVDAEPGWREANLWTTEEASALASEREEWLALVATGVRVGELSALEASDWDPDLGALRVSKAFNTREGVVQSIKSMVPRLVPVWSKLRPVIEKRAARGGLLFPAQRGGGHLRNDSAYSMLETDVRRLGLRRRGVHAFRATFITALVEAGVPPLVVESITHASRRSRHAFDGYVRVRWVAAQQAVESLPITVSNPRQLRFGWDR